MGEGPVISDAVLSLDAEVSPPNLRQVGRLRVLEALYRLPGTARTELVRVTGLSRATVSSVVDELIRSGMVVEFEELSDTRPVTTGRPPVLLTLSQSAAFAIGLDFGHDHIRVAVCDLSGNAVVDDWSAAEVDYSPENSFDLAQSLVSKALGRAGVDPGRLLGVGMGLAAPMNGQTGELHAEGILPGWRGIRPAQEMETRLGIPVQLENDANVGALGERAFGAAMGADNVIYVRLSAGIGAGLILDGRPYTGAGGLAGELGHVFVQEEGLICRCGNRGCLETVASSTAVTRLLEQSLSQCVTLEKLLEMVAAGDRGAIRSVTDAGHAIGRALAGFVNALNPETIVVGGELSAAGSALLDPLTAAVRLYSVAPSAAMVKIVPGMLGDRAEVLGAAALLLERAPAALAQQLAASPAA